ncbi:histone H1 [Diospyros lotus]|uniref:histone H1 n=1 Tax=Diospyros lotus TaxID=55363 RepID=UPI0022578FCB|nr:histone H1 [Diospyros lotus]
MVSSTDPPPTGQPPPPPPPRPAVAEPPAHVAHAANPTPPNNHHNHPPYAEMITAAIAALKERNGSSRQAIAKYIEKEYPNLPAKHSALLTHHLKRLKNSGQLLMVKHSYKLPRSTAPLLPSATDATGNGNASSSGQKRGPGRPPKARVEAQPISVGVGPESVLVSLGLVDEPAPAPAPAPQSKRGRGRPPKSGLVGMDSGAKRGRGRPPMPKPLSLLMGQSGPKRRPGRPPIGSRPRGRPKKDGSVAKTPGRGRGRPPKNAVAPAAAAHSDAAAAVGGDGALAVVGDGLLPVKRRGRPPGSGGRPRKLSGKPLGRPKKNALMAGDQAVATQEVVAYEELKNKLEHFQSRVRHAVSLVKPQLNNETAVSALGALQELEQLATLDLSTPFHVQEQ